MTNQYDPKTLNPSRGAPVRFKGRIIADLTFDTKHIQPNGKFAWMRFTVWETKGGAYIAQTSGDVPGKPDQVHCSVTVVEPIMLDKIARSNPKLPHPGTEAGKRAGRDQIAMQIAVLDHFDHHDRAKAMLKRELGWIPVIEVA